MPPIKVWCIYCNNKYGGGFFGIFEDEKTANDLLEEECLDDDTDVVKRVGIKTEDGKIHFIDTEHSKAFDLNVDLKKRKDKLRKAALEKLTEEEKELPSVF